MTWSRERLESEFDAYVLDLLDDDDEAAAAAAVAQYPDLAARADELRHALARLALDEVDGTVTAPPWLRDGMMARALVARPAGQTTDDSLQGAAASGLECYLHYAADMSVVVDALTDVELAAPTVYREPVARLVDHLAGTEADLAAALDAFVTGNPDLDPTPVAHRRRRATEVDAPSTEAVAEWHRHVDATARALALLEPDDFTAAIRYARLGWTVDTLLVARAFELWTHGDDIRRAIGFDPTVPEAAMIRTMSRIAVGLVTELVGATGGHVGSSVRFTLTGPGGGSWVRRIGEPAGRSPGTPADWQSDATLVSDVVDFCLLCADRLGGAPLHAERIGDVDLLDEIVALAPLLADFGAGPMPE